MSGVPIARDVITYHAFATLPLLARGTNNTAINTMRRTISHRISAGHDASAPWGSLLKLRRTMRSVAREVSG